MVVEPTDIVMEVLRKIQADLADLREGQREIKARLSSVERHMAVMQSDIAELRYSFDRLSDRVERVERRLGLVDA